MARAKPSGVMGTPRPVSLAVKCCSSSPTAALLLLFFGNVATFPFGDPVAEIIAGKGLSFAARRGEPSDASAVESGAGPPLDAPSPFLADKLP